MSNILILGAGRSGVGVICRVLNCHPKITVQKHEIGKNSIYRYYILDSSFYHEHKLNTLNVLNELQYSKYIWVIRDPVNSACSFKKFQEIDIGLGLSYWYNVNMCLWYFFASLPKNKKVILKYENLLTDVGIFKKVFDFIGREYDDQYRNYGDFDQPLTSDPVAKLGKINFEHIDPYIKTGLGIEELWNLYKDKLLVKKFGYNRILGD